MSALVQQRECLVDSLVARHQAVMMLFLKVAVALNETLPVFLVGDEWRELGRKGRPESADPLFITRLERTPLECVAHRCENERDRVDERSVEIEEDRERAGAGKHGGEGKATRASVQTRNEQMEGISAARLLITRYSLSLYYADHAVRFAIPLRQAPRGDRNCRSGRNRRARRQIHDPKHQEGLQGLG